MFIQLLLLYTDGVCINHRIGVLRDSAFQPEGQIWQAVCRTWPGRLICHSPRDHTALLCLVQLHWNQRKLGNTKISCAAAQRPIWEGGWTRRDQRYLGKSFKKWMFGALLNLAHTWRQHSLQIMVLAKKRMKPPVLVQVYITMFNTWSWVALIATFASDDFIHSN